jgi:uncharacterized protein (UPF0548 family)
MFYLTAPRHQAIEDFIQAQAGKPFSYQEVGATAETPPRDYTVDHNRIKLGEGLKVFKRASHAIRSWEMFNLSWLSLIDRGTPIVRGETIAVLARHFGFWSLNACRIVYVIDKEDDRHKRFGFAYGTLPDHAERGEERFIVELDQKDNSVSYDILAFSRPNHFLSLVGYPVARLLQKRFARDSKLAMLRSLNR